MSLVALRELGTCCCKASCAGNGDSIGKCDNEAAVRTKPRPKGLTARVISDMNGDSLTSRFYVNRTEGFRLYYFDHGVFDQLHYCQKCHDHP